ncbi:MAG TPA: hypothetical protein VGJ81_05295 [Thermoanaerobaculia bacterium]|jgi:tetratricopeptide (TPR) repeat protein
MIGDHFEDYELLAYEDRDSAFFDLAAADRHIAECEECSKRLDSIRAFEALLADKNVHRHARRLRGATPEMEELRLRTEVRVREQVEAERTIAELRDMPIGAWTPWLSRRTTEWTPGLVQALLAESRRYFNDTPAVALKIIATAEVIAASLPNVFDRAEAQGNTELQRANALRHLGRYHEALAATDAAYGFLAHLPMPAYDLAFATWAKATILFSMTRFDEALPLVRDAAETFLVFQDIHHARRARVLEASIVCEQGDLTRAERVYEESLEFFKAESDPEMEARLLANLADVAVRRDDVQRARSLAAEATRLFTEFDRPSEAARVRWSLGHLLIRRGALDAGLEELQGAAHEFERRGMTSAVGEVSLDVLEIHVARQDWAEAETLARRLTDLFAAAGSPVHHAQAYAHLREAILNRSATVELIGEIRESLAPGESASEFGRSVF